jgi:phosphate transport system substrate-binding protein
MLVVRTVTALFLLALMLLGQGSAVSAAGPHALAVIVHPDNPVAGLTRAKLRDLFLKASRRWSDGKQVLAINHKAGSLTREAFDRSVLRMSPDQAASYWIKQRVRGRGHPPHSFRSERLILRLVSKQREAVSYVRLEALRHGPKVKVIKIDGLLPGQPGYPLDTRGKR